MMQVYSAPKDLFTELSPGERLAAVIPTPRVSHGQIITMYEANRVGTRVLGVGAAQVMDATKRRRRMPGILFLALRARDVALASRYATLCGVTLTVLESK
jgi:hypothetical protein